jgi:nicotinamidase-related amidase
MSTALQSEFIKQKGRILDFAERVDPRSTALVVVDVQNDFCHPDGVFGRLGHDLSMMPPMAAALRELVEAARRRSMLIIWVRATYDAVVTSDVLAETYNRRDFHESQCLEGSWGADWYGGVAPREAPNEVVVTKHRFSAFWDTPIDLYLRSNKIRSVVVTGVVTSGCVESTLRDAFFNDYYVVVAADCVAEASQERHDYALRKMGQAFGVVTQAADIVRVWDGSRENARSWDIDYKRSTILNDLGRRIDPQHTALVLVDLQNDFCDPKGVMGSQGEGLEAIRAVLPNVARLLACARQAGVMVVHVKAEYGGANQSDVSLFAGAGVSATACCLPGSWGAEIVPDVAPRPGEPVEIKNRFSGFVDTGLEKLLRTNHVRTVVVVGVATQCCVESTVRDAAVRDFYVVVPRDCVAARARMRHLHEASLETMGLFFAQVVDAAAVRAIWQKVL